MNRVRQVVAWVQAGSLYVLLFLLPFSKAAVEIGFGGLLLSWLFARLDPKTRADSLWVKPALRPVLFAGAGFLAACAMSAVVSTDVVLSMKGLINKWLEYLLFVVIVADVASRKDVWQRSFMTLAASAFFVVFEGITQERYGNGFFRHYRLDFFNRMTGPYENPIDLATYFMVIIPPLMAYTFLQRGGRRWRYVGLMLAISACLARTLSLGAWISLWISLAVMSCWRTPARRYALTSLVLVPVIAGAFLLGSGRLTRAFSMSDIGKQDRLAMWQTAIHMIKDRPILGQGVNTFMANYLTYWVGGQRQPRYAHNCYLQVAAETGLVGLISFLWFLGLLGALLVDRLTRLQAVSEGQLLIGLFTGLLAFAIQAAVDTNFYSLRQAALFWVLTGVAISLGMQRGHRGEAARG